MLVTFNDNAEIHREKLSWGVFKVNLLNSLTQCILEVGSTEHFSIFLQRQISEFQRLVMNCT